ncbi:MAG: hypothetical protein IKP96_06035 [Elusimicrobiaceae bacterium]|nr:hypothetical protein [Elusimicrobiaceae bacterium]
MRNIGFFLLCLLFPAVAFPASGTEIVIELSGTPDTTHKETDITLWDKDAKQLNKLLRGKTRQEALYQISSVSSKDTIIKAQDGTRYAFVQYGDKDDYRKMLFQAEEPQLFVNCAANVQDALAVNKRYQVDIGITLKEFLSAYAEQVQELPSPLGKHLYRLESKEQEPAFFLFEKGQLLRTLTAKEVTDLQPKKTIAQTTPVQLPAPRKQPQPRKALAEGGTITDQMYMPRVTNPIPRPVISPSKTPAGTPL